MDCYCVYVEKNAIRGRQHVFISPRRAQLNVWCIQCIYSALYVRASVLRPRVQVSIVSLRFTWLNEGQFILRVQCSAYIIYESDVSFSQTHLKQQLWETAGTVILLSHLFKSISWQIPPPASCRVWLGPDCRRRHLWAQMSHSSTCCANKPEP